MDTERKSSAIQEADRLRIPIVGLVDLKMPWKTYKRVTCLVPANDTVKFVYLFCNLITKTFLYEQKKMGITSGNVAKEEEFAIEEATRPTEKSKIGGTNDELLALPYDSLLPASDDPLEIKDLLDKLVVLKINGDLGTRMGFDGPKSAIEVCSRLTSLDLIADQIESLNLTYGCNIPLLLMNAVDTHEATLKVLEKHSYRNIHSFIQDQYHRVNAKESMPPPIDGKDTVDESPYAFDHHEALLALKKSEKLDDLLSQGKEYILMLTSDNLADVVDPKILNHLIKNDVQYCMEVTPTSTRLEASVLHSQQGKSQTEEKSEFIKTTNSWVNIEAIKTRVESDNPEVNYRISELFDRAIGMNVPQSRSLPLETTSDLLLFQSDLYTCSKGILNRNEARKIPENPSIELGPEFEKVTDFRSRFKSIPRIVELDNLKVNGDVWFGANVTLKGRVSIIARPNEKITIPSGAVLENKAINSQEDVVDNTWRP